MVVGLMMTRSEIIPITAISVS